MERLEGVPTTRICLAAVESASFEEVTTGPNDDRMPQWSPDGVHLAFLSDRRAKGHFQLYLLNAGRLGEAVAAPPVEGTVEYLSWSPDGRCVLLAVAGPGADLAGGQGSGTTAAMGDGLPTWLPVVDSGVSEHQWRRLWLYDLGAGTNRLVSREGLNVWEAVWAGNDRIAAVVSQHPGEDAWYTAPLALLDLEGGEETVLYRSAWQLGLPAASPSGRRLAVVEAVCSDRWVVAGDVLYYESSQATPVKVDTRGVDVTYLIWRNEDRLFYAGLRGVQTVFGEYDATSGQVEELWVSEETSGQRYPSAQPVGSDAFALVLHSYRRYPEVAIVRDGVPRSVAFLAHAGSDYLGHVGGAVETVKWHAPDGLEIEGILAQPEGRGPHPLVVLVHGGPVWAFRNSWSMYYQYTPLLVSRGYAVLHPNPRGSAGRGQDFAARVYGDMGGADAEDILSGIDALVARGLVDTNRVAVTGGSYGGFMSCWLITRTDRFAAAMPMSPVTNWFSTHYTSNIGYFDQAFLQDSPSNMTGRFALRSPLFSASKVRTPTLQTTGALDRCTPPTQAVEFHHALLEQGVAAELVIYPQEGHGVRQFPAVIDQCTRMAAWFERYMPAH